MGTTKKPKPVKFFASIIMKDTATLQRIEERLLSSIGTIEERTPFMPFVHTRYYEKEMGAPLMRCFLLFTPLLKREMLPSIKLQTNDIESTLSVEGKRRVNIDPGYIALEHVILATTKGYTHRIYIENGIFADLTLMFYDGTYRPLDWTYPDYRNDDIISFFNHWRERLKQQIKEWENKRKEVRC